MRLLQDSSFANELRCTYEDYRQTMLSNANLFAYIDSISALVQNAKDRHFQKWPILGISGPAPDFGPVATTYAGELDTLKNWIAKRMAWLDANIPGLCPPVGVTEAGAAVSVSCYPNPTNGDLNLAFVLTAETDVAIRMYNAAGTEVWSVARGMFGVGRHVVGLDAGVFPAGIYVVKFELGDVVVMRKVLVLE